MSGRIVDGTEEQTKDDSAMETGFSESGLSMPDSPSRDAANTEVSFSCWQFFISPQQFNRNKYAVLFGTKGRTLALDKKQLNIWFCSAHALLSGTNKYLVMI